MKFNKKLKEILNWKGINQTEFANMLGVEKSNITNWIKGKSAPNLELFYRICFILDETPNYFLGFEN